MMHLFTIWTVMIVAVACREVLITTDQLLRAQLLLPTNVTKLMNFLGTLREPVVSLTLIDVCIRAMRRSHGRSICLLLHEDDLIRLHCLVAVAFTWRGNAITRASTCAMIALLQQSSSTLVFLCSALLSQRWKWKEKVMPVHMCSLLYASVHVGVCPRNQSAAAALFVAYNTMSMVLILLPLAVVRVQFLTAEDTI